MIFRNAITQWRVIRAEFQDYLENAYQNAETWTNGNLLNARGRHETVNAFSLMYGPRVRVEAFASDELKEFFEIHGRLTYAEYEAAMIEGGST